MSLIPYRLRSWLIRTRWWNAVAAPFNWLGYRLLPSRQYHLVNTGLPPGYYDPDTRLLHACFAMLVYHVEQEVGGLAKLEEWTNGLRANPDPNAPEGWEDGQATRQSEAALLYRWWTIEKPADEAKCEAMLMHLYGRRPRIPWTEADKAMHEEFRALEAKIASDEQSMLHRLIDIRGSLWI